MQPTTLDDGDMVAGEDLMVSIVEISYGKGYSNPVDHAHFLTKDGVEFGQITSEKVSDFYVNRKQCGRRASGCGH